METGALSIIPQRLCFKAGEGAHTRVRNFAAAAAGASALSAAAAAAAGGFASSTAAASADAAPIAAFRSPLAPDLVSLINLFDVYCCVIAGYHVGCCVYICLGFSSLSL